MKVLTKAEKVEILEETFRLIEQPANWITGTWKCPLYELDKNKKVKLDENRQPIPVYDRFNRPQAQYCIEGAANAAAINVLGERRAANFVSCESDDQMADLLGLNELVRELHPDFESAMDLNDSFSNGGKQHEKGHKTIVGLVRARIEELKSRKRVPAGVS